MLTQHTPPHPQSERSRAKATPPGAAEGVSWRLRTREGWATADIAAEFHLAGNRLPSGDFPGADLAEGNLAEGNLVVTQDEIVGFAAVPMTAATLCPRGPD